MSSQITSLLALRAVFAEACGHGTIKLARQVSHQHLGSHNFPSTGHLTRLQLRPDGYEYYSSSARFWASPTHGRSTKKTYLTDECIRFISKAPQLFSDEALNHWREGFGIAREHRDIGDAVAGTLFLQLVHDGVERTDQEIR